MRGGNIMCPYCNSKLEMHKFKEEGIYILYICDKMPKDGRIWCIPEIHISINHPSHVTGII